MTRHFRFSIAAFAFLLAVPPMMALFPRGAFWLPAAGALLTTAAVLISCRRGRTPGVAPVLGAVVAAFAAIGAGSVLTLRGSDDLPWVLLCFVPAWAVRLRWTRWLPLMVAVGLVVAVVPRLEAVEEEEPTGFDQHPMPPKTSVWSEGTLIARPSKRFVDPCPGCW